MLLATAVHVTKVLWWRNFHPVLPGLVYRAAQMTGPKLEQVIRAHGIRTVINLRGKCELDDWYHDECQATQRADINQEDICLSAGRLPSTEEIRDLVRILDRTAYPILIHCRQGADRTGLVSTLILLLLTDAQPTAALDHLNMRFGHVRLGHTAYMDQFFELYAEWLQAQGQTHSRALFRRWLEDDYCPAMCRARLEPIEVPRTVDLDRPWAARVRAHNASVKNWPFRTGKTAGVHLGFRITDLRGSMVADGRAGLLRADVAPGASIELTVALPPLPEPGQYVVMFDMIDEQQCWFYQAGSPPLECAVEVKARSQESGVRGR